MGPCQKVGLQENCPPFLIRGAAFALQAVEAEVIMSEHSLMLLCLAGIGFKSWLKLIRKSKKAEV